MTQMNRSMLEGLYERGTISRAQFLQALTVLGVSASTISTLLGSSPPSVEAEGQVAEYLVLIVMDAFRPDYMRLAPMPALEALMRRGTNYDRAWVGQLESETPTGHATLSTGCMPRDDGIIGFEWRDPRTGKEVLDGWPPGIRSGAMERDLRASGAPSIALAIKANNPKDTVVSLSSEKIYAADALGGWAADYILYHQRVGQGPERLVPTGVPGHVPPEDFLALPGLEGRLPLSHFTDWDYLSTILGLAAFAAFHPKALLVNLPGADVYGHAFGGPATPGVMRQVVAGVDRNIARIVNAYKQAGIYEKTVFVITADHGMVPNAHSVDGSVTKAVTRQAGGQYLFHTGGTAADVYLANPQSASAVATAMARTPGVNAAYHQIPNEDGRTYALATPSRIAPELDAAYQHLLGTFAGKTAPHVVAPFRENTIGTKESIVHGDHGGLNWGAQHVPLILAGPGIRAGRTSHFPVRLMDVAPTILRLLGLPASPMDGVILSDALDNATADEAVAQNDLAATLTGVQDALIVQSTADITQDSRERISPPPSAPERP